MSGQFFKFAVKDLRPRDLSVGQAFAAFWRVLFSAAVVAPINWLRIRPCVVAVFFVGLLLFVFVFVGALFALDADSAPDKIRCILCILKEATDEIALPYIIGVLMLVKCVQYVLDWRDWHVPWAIAHQDRFVLLKQRVGAQDFPILILGRGGSGKSTLAKILEHDFLRRQIFKPSGFQDEGGDERLVVRAANDAIGGSVRKYDVTWRPDLYKVGHLAEAYDMPGQIISDWRRALDEVKDCRRVAIINVLTNGYSSQVTKFEPNEVDNTNNISEHTLDECIRRGDLIWKKSKKKGLKSDDNAHYLARYRQHIINEELDGLSEVFDEVKCKWRNGHAPKLLLIHVVNKADVWVSMRNDLQCGAHAAMKNSVNVLREYEKRFSDLHGEIESHINENGGSFVYKFLPASLQFGDTRHKEGHLIFDSTSEIESFDNKTYEEKQILKIKKKALLGQATVKSIRAIRQALYRRNGEWNDKSTLGESYPLVATEDREDDLYDIWRREE